MSERCSSCGGTGRSEVDPIDGKNHSCGPCGGTGYSGPAAVDLPIRTPDCGCEAQGSGRIFRMGAIMTGEDLRDRRKRKGWTLATLAKQTGLSYTYLSKIENGHHYPSEKARLTIMAALTRGCAHRCMVHR